MVGLLVWLTKVIPKKKGKQRSKSLAVEVIEFLTEIKGEERKEKQKFDLAERMHKEKMCIMA